MENRRYILAHDLGTTGNKASLFNEEGALLGSAFAAYETAYPQPNWAEQNPEDWWRAVCDTSRRLISETGVDPAAIAAIGFSGQMMGMVAIDAQGKVLRSCIIWADQRAQEHDAERGAAPLHRGVREQDRGPEGGQVQGLLGQQVVPEGPDVEGDGDPGEKPDEPEHRLALPAPKHEGEPAETQHDGPGDHHLEAQVGEHPLLVQMHRERGVRDEPQPHEPLDDHGGRVGQGEGVGLRDRGGARDCGFRRPGSCVDPSRRRASRRSPLVVRSCGR